MAYIVGEDFTEQLYSGESIFRATLKINNVTIPNDQIASISISSPIIDDSKQVFYIGSFISQKITIHFKNMDNIDVESGQEVSLSIGQYVIDEIDEESSEWVDVPIGKFIVDDLSEDYYDKCEISCLDYAVKFKPNVDYSECFTNGKATIKKILQYVCEHCGVLLGDYPEINDDVEIGTYDSTVSGKQWISYIAEIKGCNAKIDREGKLTLQPLKQPSKVSINALESASFETGEKFKISQVTYFDAIRNFTFGNDTDNTLFIRQDNPFINDENVVKNVYESIVNQEETTTDDNYFDLDNTDEYNITLKKIYGETSQDICSGKNLYGIPDQTFTFVGVTVTIKDGVITYNGTTNGTSVKVLNATLPTTLKAGQYTLSQNFLSGSTTDTTDMCNFNVRNASNDSYIFGCVTSSNEASYTLASDTSIKFGLYFQPNITFNNYSFRPQLEVGSTATEYEKYVGGSPSPNPEWSQYVNTVQGDNKVDLVHKNFFDTSNMQYTNTWEALSVTFDNGIISFDGSNNSAGAIVSRYIKNGFMLPSGTYTISWRKVSGSFEANGNSTALYFRKYSNAQNQDTAISQTNIAYISSNDLIQTFTLSEDTEVSFEIYTNGAITYNDFVISIQIEKGNTATEFEECKKQVYGIDLPVINLIPYLEQGSFNYLNGSDFDNADRIRTNMFVIKPNTVYTVSSDLPLGECCCVYYQSNGTTVIPGSVIANDTTTKVASFTTPSNAHYIRMRFGKGDAPRHIEDNNKIQLEEGSEANAYVPYGSVPLGENLFDRSISQGRWKITVGATIAPTTQRGFRNTNPIPIKPSTQYTISGTVYKDTGAIYIVEADENGTILAISGNNAYIPFNYVTDKWSSMTFTSHSSARSMYWYTTGANTTNYPNDLRIEEGGRATDRSVELCNVCDYEDYEEDTVNLLDYRKLLTSSTGVFSQRGATITNNLDGTFTISGTGNITGGAFGGGFTDLTHAQTVKLFKKGTLTFSCEACTPAVLIEGKDGNTTVFQLTSYDGTTKTTEITQAMLDNSNFKIRYSFYSTEGRAITPETIHPMVYQEGGGTFEPIKYKNYKDYITKNTGKNLFDISIWYNDRADHKWSGSGTFTITKDGSVISDIPNKMDYYTPSPHMNATNPTPAQKEMVIKYGLEVKPNTTYTLSFDNPNGCNMQYFIFRYDNDCNYVSHWASSQSTSKKRSYAYTTSSNQRYLFIRFDNESYDTTPTQLNISNIQIEENNVATDFEPYGNGEWYKYSNCAKYLLEDTIAWSTSGAGVDTGVKCYRTNKAITDFNGYKSGYCDKARILSQVSWNNTPKPSGTAVLTDNYLFFRISETIAPDIASFRTWVANNPITVYTRLDSPICDKITYQPLIDQLDAINENAHTYEGKTYVYTEGPYEKSDININYYTNTNFELYSVKTKNYGDFTLDAWDNIEYDLDGVKYNTLNNNNITYEMTVMSDVDTKIPTKQQTVTTNIIGGDSKVNIKKIKTEVDNLNATATILAEQQDETSHNLASLQVAVNSIQNLFTLTGGNNIIRNSAFLLTDTVWGFTDNGNNPYHTALGSSYNSIFAGKTVSISEIKLRNVKVKSTTDNITGLKNDGTRYTLNFYYKQDANTTTTIKLYDTNNTSVKAFNDIVLAGEKDFTNYEIAFVPSSSSYTLEIITSSTANGYFYLYDLMLNSGDKQPWQPAPDEIYSTTLTMSRQGLKVYSVGDGTITLLGSDGLLSYETSDGKTLGRLVSQRTVDGDKVRSIDTQSIELGQDITNSNVDRWLETTLVINGKLHKILYLESGEE